MRSGDESFISAVVDPIEGWLDRFTAKRTIDLLDRQEELGVTGPLYEIGLYRGKYFSILVRAGLRTNDRILGLDTFEYVARSDFTAGFLVSFTSVDGSPSTSLDALGVRLIEGRTTDLGVPELREHLGSAARFISIDGSHEYDDVLWDLSVAREVLKPGGLIAVDDYLHPVCLGVTTATDRFLAQTTDLVPFAYIANKLFLCRPGWADRYRSHLEVAIVADRSDPKGAAFAAQVEAGASARRNIEATYAGYRVLTVAL
jgi:hypothetical protein